jgi:hypothetical protein
MTKKTKANANTAVPEIDYPKLMETAMKIGDPYCKTRFQTNVIYILRNEIDSLDFEIRAKAKYSLADNLDYWGGKLDAVSAADERGVATPEEVEDVDQAYEATVTFFRQFAKRQQYLKDLYATPAFAGVPYEDRATRQKVTAPRVTSAERQEQAMGYGDGAEA